MKVETVRKSIRELQKKFSKTPLNYTEEYSLMAELQDILRKRGKKITASAEYKDFKKEDYEEDYTKYKETYLERICSRNKIHNVQIGVNIGNPKKDKVKGKNKLLDLAVLREKETEIKLIKGTNYFTPQSIEHAVEIKFIKKQNIPPKNLMNKLFKKDLKILQGLGEPKSRHLVIFSNKNIFQQKEEDEEYTNTAHERFGELKNKFKKENVIVEECYPGKKIEKD